MADMDDYSYGVALQYGDPGPATYSSSAQAWRFTRHFSSSRTFSFTGWSKRVTSPLVDLVNSSAANRDNKNEEELWISYPELITITPLFARDEALSRVIYEAESNFNPQTSSLLDFGNARLSQEIRTRESRIRVLPISAFASGTYGDALTLRAIDADTISTTLNNDSSVRVPTIGDSSTIEWICSATPIRQIRFADSLKDPGCLLAVRLKSCISIFQPIAYPEARLIVPPLISGCAYSEPQVSYIDPNLITEINVTQTGGYAHVDVAFNPWHTKELAIVDERGHWSIWQLPDSSKHSASQIPSRLRAGRLPYHDCDDDNDNTSTDEIQYDSWGRVDWVRDVYTFVVCSRRNAMLYVLDENATLSYVVQLNLQSPNEWLLDMKTSPSQPSLVFFLTTSRIICFDFTSHNQGSETFLPQAAWQHRRDPDDLTLRLTTLSVGEEFYLLLYSRLDACILAFQVRIAEDDDENSFLSDPFWIYVPGVNDTNGLKTIRYDSPIRHILFREVEPAPLPSRRDVTQFPRFLKLFMVDGAMAIHEYLFTKMEEFPSEGNIKPGREILSSKAMTALKTKMGKLSTDRIELSSEGANIFYLNEVHHLSSYRPARMNKKTDPPLYVDFTRIYALLSNDASQYWRRPLAMTGEYQSFGEYLKCLTTAISTSAEEGQSFMHTMLDIIDNPPASSDIDDISHGLEWFKSHFAPRDAYALIALCFLPLNVPGGPLPEKSPMIRSLASHDLVSLYDTLVRDWLSPLPRRIPGWTRVSKERLIRKVSVELSLASTVQVDVSVPDNESVVSSQTSLPERADFRAGEQYIHKEDSQAKHDTIGLKILSPRSMGPPLSSAVQNILSHWTIGENPDSFDWEKALVTDIVDNDTFSRSRSRSKSTQRTWTRTRSRSRATSEGSRAIRSSPVTPMNYYPDSQPQLDVSRLPIRSSQVIEDVLPMTQTERGIFGSREAGKNSNVKARKKKRAAGF